MEKVKKKRPIKAKVWEIKNGAHGLFAICKPVYKKDQRKIKGTITISLEEKRDEWKEEKLPVAGDLVLLHGVREREAGYVAEKGEFARI